MQDNNQGPMLGFLHKLAHPCDRYIVPLQVNVLERPWGLEEILAEGLSVCSVRYITIKPREAPSWHYHERRDELFVILEGEAELLVGKDKSDIVVGGPGQFIFVPRHVPHRISTMETGVRLLEIDFGERDQGDIVRLADNYGAPDKGDRT